MTVLGDVARARTAATWMRENKTSVAFSKPQLVAAVAATDDWIEAQSVAFNAALPAGFRNAATPDQKMEIFAYILWRRINRLRADED